MPRTRKSSAFRMDQIESPQSRLGLILSSEPRPALDYPRASSDPLKFVRAMAEIERRGLSVHPESPTLH